MPPLILIAAGDLAGACVISGTSTGSSRVRRRRPEFLADAAGACRAAPAPPRRAPRREALQSALWNAIPARWLGGRPADALFRARLLARNGWGQERSKLLRFAFYVRSHWLRMPPLMLVRHLWIKALR